MIKLNEKLIPQPAMQMPENSLLRINPKSTSAARETSHPQFHRIQSNYPKNFMKPIGDTPQADTLTFPTIKATPCTYNEEIKIVRTRSPYTYKNKETK